MLTWQRTVIWLLFSVASHVRLQRISAGMVALLALALAPFARVFCLLRSSSRAVDVLHMIHKLVVVLCRTPRAILPLALGLRILSDRVLVM